ncbi:hypothetical protein CMK18_12235 [Candidatus Poribacteria bacterium]|nr:hypothetical protein [Candidatus Poribacteria bacterium]
MKPVRVLFYFSFLFLLGFLLACQPENPSKNKQNNSGETHHQHVAPHGGTLVVLGNEFAHLELVLNQDKGELTIYVLDGETRNGVRLTQPTIILKTKTDSAADFNELELQAVANSLSGETVGDSSVFIVQSETLINQDRFSVEIEHISIKGQKFQNLSFSFPEGNETDHAEEHKHVH